MNTKKHLLLFITILSLFISCDDDDNNAEEAAVDKIEITVDDGTPISYATNIVAKDVVVAPQTGFSCVFRITSSNANNDVFELAVGASDAPCPLVVTVPSTRTLVGQEISVLNIQGLNIDNANPGNNIVLTYIVFGNNVGDDIEIDFAGTYYDTANAAHTVTGEIDILRQ